MPGRTIVRWIALAAFVGAAPVWAQAIRMDLGADYSFPQDTGIFSVMFQVNAPLTRHLSVGGRFGGMFMTSPQTFGVPLDLSLRANIQQLYLEGVAGPWIEFNNYPIRAHAAFGFGLQTRVVSFGAEMGYFDGGGIVGVRLEFHL